MQFLAVSQDLDGSRGSPWSRESPDFWKALLNGRKDFLVGRHTLFGKYDLEIGADDIDCPLDQLTQRLQGFVLARDFLVGIG